MSAALERLARLYGVADTWLDYRGQPREVSLESKIAILSAMGVTAAGEESADKAINQYETTRWTRLAPPVAMAAEGAAIDIPITTPHNIRAKTLTWEVKCEDGATKHGSQALANLQRDEQRSVEGVNCTRVMLTLPGLPLGYHTASLTLDSGLNADVHIVVTPGRCYEPPAIAAGKKLWGLAVQLYAVRSPRNWGMGDFRDLRELIELAAPLGCDIIGLNPLHALMPADPAHISPYSPSSRLFLNVLYICVEDVAEFTECAAARKHVASKSFQTLLQELRATTHVDYVRMANAKFAMLKMLYAHFRSEHLERDSARAAEFRAFVDQGGEPLQRHAVYDALDAHWRLQGPQYWGWPSWPEEYRDPTALAVNRFARERAQDVEYFLYLQWLAHVQLRAAQSLARERGMAVGLYGDVAVGANSAGSEVWSNRRLYVHEASIGAPPDALALKGQDWGIPPQNPEELRQQQFRPFISLIENNMDGVAGLRLDHVMTLYRLWWVPRGLLSKDGAYVHYPLNELMAIMTLESHRHRCVVIGEDLGTVPQEMTQAMERGHAYHYKVLLFEQTDSGEFNPPAAYVRTALATITTHDLPTLRGWWEAHDVELRERLDLYPNQELRDQARETRERERRALTRALVAAGLWRWSEQDPTPSYSSALSRAVHAFLGLSNANIAIIQLEDLIGMLDPVNVPGTNAEHPNWQRKIELDTAHIFQRADVLDIVKGMHTARSGRNPNA